MLFHSSQFLLAFLPATIVLFYITARYTLRGSVVWLLIASLAFYAYWDWRYLFLLVPSIVFNFLIGEAIRRREGRARRTALIFGTTINLVALAIFKYAGFLAETVNLLVAAPTVPVPHIELPLGISFFTFTQIAYLVDVAQRKVAERDAVGYGLFVTFFPHLIAGPILHHAEMMPQFRRPEIARVDPCLMYEGAVLFLVGLFKKLVLADTFAQWVGPGFDAAPSLSFVEAWATSLAYFFQLYFDFSGYSDMAIGLGLMVNVRLPLNFNSPYRSTSIQEFWTRWHMTLSRFLRDYLYVPLGGNRRSLPRVCLNLFLVFLIGGLWHGAGWTFVAWGAAHGIAMVVHRLWQQTGLKLSGWLAWLLTMQFVNASWVLFRAGSWADAIKVYKGMLGMSGFQLPSQVLDLLPALKAVFAGVGTLPYVGGGTVMGLVETALLTATAAGLVLLPLNSNRLHGAYRWAACGVAFPFVLQAVLFKQVPSPFLYFQF